MKPGTACHDSGSGLQAKSLRPRLLGHGVASISGYVIRQYTSRTR